MDDRYQELLSEICENLWLEALDLCQGDSAEEQLRALRASNSPLDCLRLIAAGGLDGPAFTWDVAEHFEFTVPIVERIANEEVSWDEALDLASELLQPGNPYSYSSSAKCALATLRLAREFTPEGKRTQKPLRVESPDPVHDRPGTHLFRVEVLSERPWEPREKQFWALFFAASIEAEEAEQAALAWVSTESSGFLDHVIGNLTAPAVDDFNGQLASLAAVLAERARQRRQSDAAGEPVEIREQMRQMRRAQIEDRGRLVRIEMQVRQQTDLLLDMPELISGQLREDWEAEAAFSVARDALLRGWHATARAERDEAPLLAARQSVGEAAWPLLAQESRDDLLGAQLIKQNWGSKYLAHAAIGFFRALERELRIALAERTGKWTVDDLAGATPRQLVDLAKGMPDGDRLHGIAVRADEARLVELRNRAAHPGRFTRVEMQKTEEVLFKDGLDGKGLLGLIATYRG